MITTARTLKKVELFLPRKKGRKKSLWCNDGKELLLSKSWMSLYCILELVRSEKNRKPVVYIPAYFCADTLLNLNDVCHLVLYEIDDEFKPINSDLKGKSQSIKPDVVVFVHYFGQILDAGSIKTFCKNNDAILIEDAAHVLYPEKKVGKFGDFVLYSPWKSLGLPDGAVLIINSNDVLGLEDNQIEDRLLRIVKSLPEHSHYSIIKWKLKNVIKRIAPNKRIYNELESKPNNKEKLCQISEFSRSFLLHISEENLLEIGERKKENYSMMRALLKEKYGIETVASNNLAIPYVLGIDISNVDKREIKNELRKIGNIVFEWPDLLHEVPYDSRAVKNRNSMLFISIHDDINAKAIVKKLNYQELYNDERIDLCKIDLEEYSKLSSSLTEPLPILQSIEYIKAKEKTQNWKVSYWKIVHDDIAVGCFASLEKYGIVYRINHGPIVESEYLGLTVKAIKAEFGSGLKVLFWAPNFEKTGYNLLLLEKCRLHYRKQFFTTGYIYLLRDEDELRKNLDSKWRNALRSAEKQNLVVKHADTKEQFDLLMELHSKDKDTRNYNDSGDLITKSLCDDNSIFGLYAINDSNDIISFVMIAIHANTATYYIGWSNKEGYRMNANRLLLWKAMMEAKGKGIYWFDLGGIDFIHTKSIAEFKQGTGCRIFEFVGEYTSL